MGTLSDKAVARTRDAVQQRLRRPVLGVASFVREGLPQPFLLAVTEDRVHALGFASHGLGVTIEGELGEWDRAHLRVEVEEDSIEPRVTVTPPGEQPIRCRGRTSPQTTAVLNLLTG